MKIVSTGRTLSTKDYYQKQLKERRRKMLIIGSVLLVLLIALILLLRLQHLQIGSIQVTGTEPLTGSAVKEAANSVLDGYYLWIIPKRDFVIYPGGEIRRALTKKFPRFSSMNFSLEGAKTLDISLTERKPFALYCAQNDACYFIDEAGFIFDAAPTFSEGVYFVYKKSADISEPLGQNLLSQSEFKTLSEFVENIIALTAGASISPREALVSDTEVHISLSSGAVILLTRGADLEKLSSDLESFLKSPEIGKQQNFWSRLETLDVRTSNKIFYTFKAE